MRREPQNPESSDGVNAERFVRALAFAAESFLSATDWEPQLGDVLGEIGTALSATRAAIYQNASAPREHSSLVPRVEWRSDPAAPPPGPRDFPRWTCALAQGGAIFGTVASLPPEESLPLLAEGVRSVMAVSVHARDLWWGSIVIEDSVCDRVWTRAELQVVMAASHALGAALVQERSRHDLLELEERYKAIVESQTELICRFRGDGVVTFANEAYLRRFSLTPAAATENPIWSYFSSSDVLIMRDALAGLELAGDAATLETGVVLPGGGECWVQWNVRATAIGTGGVVEYQAVGSDVTERHCQLTQLEHEAYYDELTGIANRRLFADRGRRVLSLARRLGWTCGLLLIDLDKFKGVNDSLGHEAGDVALIQIARRLELEVREVDVLARLGGDEYAILLSNVDRETIASVGRRLMAAIEAPLAVHGESVLLSASIGVAVYPDDPSCLEDLLRHADTAMYRAKISGGGVRFCDEHADSASPERHRLQDA